MNKKAVKILEETIIFSNQNNLYRNSHISDYTNFEYKPVKGIQPVVEFTTEKTQDAYIRNIGSGKIVLHNFASGHNPGGGVRRGAPAQEEDLCRCSNLLLELDRFPQFYEDNRNYKDGAECLDKMIFSEICLIKDGNYKFWHREDVPVLPTVSVVTYMAPSISKGVSHEDSQKIIARRLRHIIHKTNKVGANVLITGAWGCGAYGNDPAAVANIYADVIKEGTGNIKKIVFAVYGNEDNQREFLRVANMFQKQEI